jgi:hypothetical protein
MPSVRDMKGRVIDTDPAPVNRRQALPPEPPDVLSPEALAVKRRLEARSPGAAPSEPADAPGVAPAGAPAVLPPDLAAALTEIDEAMRELRETLDTMGEALTGLAASVTALRARATADAEALAQLARVRQVFEASS